VASQYGKLAVVARLLQDPRVDPSDRDNQAIRKASNSGRLAVVERLLQDPRVVIKLLQSGEITQYLQYRPNLQAAADYIKQHKLYQYIQYLPTNLQPQFENYMIQASQDGIFD
jgi:hypothetical protein